MTYGNFVKTDDNFGQQVIPALTWLIRAGFRFVRKRACL